MPEYELIYDTKIRLPEKPINECILNYNLPTKEQKWVRRELPSIFNKLNYDKDKNLVLTDEQESFADEEVRRCREGIWIYINGSDVFITKKYYFYLQWWVLEDGTRPEYRDCDRRYFLFLEHWENVLWCLGIVRGKKRREGASSQATSNLIWECIFYENSNCGLISKTRDDSRDTFTDMVGFGYRQLPPFLKPKQINKEDSVTEYVFEQKYTGLSTETEIKRSKINFRAPVLNAYDRGRMSRILLDEFGKLEKDVPASTLFNIISKTLVKGIKSVGFVEMPSTVNKLTKGGSEYRKIWDYADLNKKTPTVNRLIRYFTPAHDGLEGFIGEFGESVVDAPTDEQYQYLISKWVKRDEDGALLSEVSEEDIKLGSKAYIQKRRIGFVGDDLEEEIRMFPENEIELFMSANADCIFDVMKLSEQIEFLKQKQPPIFKRKIVYYRDFNTQKAAWRDIQKHEEYFCWEWIGDLNLHGEDNKFYMDNFMRKPARGDVGAIGVDGISSEQGGKKYGSKASAWAFIKYDLQDPENTGLFTGHLYGRPQELKELYDQVMLCAEYHGFIVYWEHVADAYYPYFKERGRLGYLAKYPLSTIAPEKRKLENYRNNLHYGYPTTDFAISRGHDAMISYVLNFCYKIYWIELCEDLKEYDQNKRTPHDRSVSAMITLVGSLEPVRKPMPIKMPLIDVYKN